ncbi:MAG: hypothetical protein ACTSPY_10300 [Candidatus Helarchaeota archaeon]
MGACYISRKIFAEHVYGLITHKGYYSSTWKLIDKNNYSKGIYGKLIDKKNRIYIIKILYNNQYPIKPPIIHSTPPIRDLCWDSKGYLHFAIKKDIFSWDLFKNYSNPLIYIVDELVTKYKIV